MRILVTAASKHGATSGIAAAIGDVLHDAGHEVHVAPPDDVPSIDQYDAVVLGSGVYAGRWLGPANAFAVRFDAALKSRPLWLFSSGPVGDEAKPVEAPADALALLATLEARGHRLFAGRLVREELGFVERGVIAVVRAPLGDFRDWRAIAGWAVEIAAALERMSPVPA
jgi:menaquinone-dependent protoporphyrinogen oxidase